MGTMLQQRVSAGGLVCFDALSVTDPDVVLGVHRDYVAAGAGLILTNTFGANAVRLATWGWVDVEAINAAAVELARRATEGTDVLVGASVGPLGSGVTPYGRTPRERAREIFAQQLAALRDVDVVALQTFGDHNEIAEGIAAARETLPDVPLIAQMTFGRDDRTALGLLPGRAAGMLLEAGADVIGANCSGGPAQIRRVLTAMRRSHPDATYVVEPNAGLPEEVGGRMIYRAGPDYFARMADQLRAEGAMVIAGCCGTTPAHIEAMAGSLARPAPLASPTEVQEPEQDHVDGDEPFRPTELGTRLSDGRFTISVEMSPPRGPDADKIIAAGEMLRDAGAHLLNVADSPAARMKMSPWAIAQVVQQQVGLETILHFPTRGRNLLRVQGDLLASHALGLRNLFVTMGDPTRIGDYPEAMDAFDIAPSALMATITSSLNAGLDHGGAALGRRTSFLVGCALNMAADDMDHELTVLERKLAAGAGFALCQPVFRPEPIERFHEAYERRTGEAFTLPVLMGVMPLYGLRQASFLHNEVPGISIPDDIFARLEDAGDDAPAEGVRIAIEVVAGIRSLVQGAYIIPPLGRYGLAAEVVGSIR